MKEEYGYLDDKELQDLIAQVENGGMVMPPVYLKDQIMGEVLKAASESEKTAPGNVQSENNTIFSNLEKRKNAAKMQFLTYSLKILAAAAMAVFCLTAVPMDFSGTPAIWKGNNMEQRINRDMERYEEESKKLLDEKPLDMKNEYKDNLKELISDKSEELIHIWSDLTN
ncbi:MAG: hypothetical protein GX235_10435 [Clostridiales bacterium]|nr:hypothetical protein [Clostridiales bacterium]